MKIALIVNIAANGKVLLSENTSYQAPQEAIPLFMEVATRAGNLVMGRSTFEMLQKVFPDVKAAFPGVELVVISASTPTTDYKVVGSPEEAIDYLTEKGSVEIAVGGGPITYNAFLEKDLVTDLYFNILPVVVGHGGVLVTDDALTTRFKLVYHKGIGADIVQLYLTRE
ncbi:dihydrofolate reductase family protein [Chitinophaga nivalis]|uniref:Dihydrofolate reductase n=1 Tax=Chitinophaga nivalis TaxID=2991709 RepID=A0ABT3IJY7_9BACT|nr:dihydrofolate reductase [Chitinophaga nivalis]MCW3466189.1 dihydrofolate reductase [Chitinophaga nivalis]MCW3484120.1 dihydrofolate reductase [Chitinophaga nivalis]